MRDSDMPGCCAAVVLHDLSGASKESIRGQLEDLKDPPEYRGNGIGIVLATTARQPNAEKALKANGFKMLMTGISNHGEYPVKVWGKSLRRKSRAKKRSQR